MIAFNGLSSRWTAIELDAAYRFENLGAAAALFNSYHCITNIILISLLTGLIWEIYTFVNKNLEEETNIRYAILNITSSLKKFHRRTAKSMKTMKSDLSWISKNQSTLAQGESTTALKDQEDAQTNSGLNVIERLLNRTKKIDLEDINLNNERDLSQSGIEDATKEDKKKLDEGADKDHRKIPILSGAFEAKKFKSSKLENNENLLQTPTLQGTDKRIEHQYQIPILPSLVYQEDLNPLYMDAGSLGVSFRVNDQEALLQTPLKGSFNTEILHRSARREPEDPIPRHYGDNAQLDSRKPSAIQGPAMAMTFTKKAEYDPQDDPDQGLTLGFEKISKTVTFILEKEVYTKKFTVYKHVEIKKNQLDNVLTPDLRSKEIDTEALYLRLEDEDDNQEEKIEAEVLAGADFLSAISLAGIENVDQEKYDHLYERVLTSIQLKEKKFMNCKYLKFGFIVLDAPTVDRIIRTALLEGTDMENIKV
jgi:hypothetical protein